MIEKKKAFVAPNGEFVKEWQYSQGHFDVIHTKKATEASCPQIGYFKDSFDTFFKHRGYKFVELEFNIKVKEIGCQSVINRS